jgi:5-methylcytosine-specific restriction protein A
MHPGLTRLGSVATLSELTDPAAVERALADFRRLGRDGFLELHGLQRSRDYFVRVDGELYDSKPILAVAHGYQHPDHGLLSVRDFNGGTSGAVRALRRLGFEAVTRVQLHPPAPGEEHADRTAVYEAYGGDRVAGIIRFPGDGVVNVFSDAEGPYADDPPTLTERHCCVEPSTDLMASTWALKWPLRVPVRLV